MRFEKTMTDTVRVAIVGHSFIRRLGEFMDKNNIVNFNLDKEVFSICIRGRGGLRVTHLARDPSLLSFPANTPDICFLQIGENDITKDLNPQKLAMDIVAVARYLHDGVGVKRVLIGQLLRRLPYVAGQHFNASVIEVNKQLRAMTEQLEGVVFWSNRGFWQDLTFLGPDGVHLLSTPSNSQPMRKFLRSIRNSILITSKQLRPV